MAYRIEPVQVQLPEEVSLLVLPFKLANAPKTPKFVVKYAVYRDDESVVTPLDTREAAEAFAEWHRRLQAL